MQYLAFDKKNIWEDWDEINQDFKISHKIRKFGKDKIWGEVIVLDRINGTGRHGSRKYVDCKVIKNLPKKNVKQKF